MTCQETVFWVLIVTKMLQGDGVPLTPLPGLGPGPDAFIIFRQLYKEIRVTAHRAVSLSLAEGKFECKGIQLHQH